MVKKTNENDFQRMSETNYTRPTQIPISNDIRTMKREHSRKPDEIIPIIEVLFRVPQQVLL